MSSLTSPQQKRKHDELTEAMSPTSDEHGSTSGGLSMTQMDLAPARPRKPWRKSSSRDSSDLGAARAAADVYDFCRTDCITEPVSSTRAEASPSSISARPMCNICFEVISKQQQVAVREEDCPHAGSFCYDCVHHWCNDKLAPTCPSCRRQITSIERIDGTVRLPIMSGK